MPKFNFDGTWITADNYADARKIYQSGKAKGGPVATAAPPPVVVLPNLPQPPVLVKVPSLPKLPDVKLPDLPVPPPQPPDVKGVTADVVVYRGDSREPGELKAVGFQLWGEAIANVSKAKGIANYLRNCAIRDKNGATFADFVRQAKNQARPTISTSRNQGCGGYDSGPIYKIVFNGLFEYDFDERVMPAGAPFPWRSDGLKVYMDKPTLQASKIIVIDLRLATEEWAFCTPIPVANITEYKLKGGNAFLTMATVVAKVKKLW